MVNWTSTRSAGWLTYRIEYSPPIFTAKPVAPLKVRNVPLLVTSIDVESGFVAAAVAPRVAAKSAVSVNRVNSVLMREHGCVFRHAVAATTSVATIANE